MDPLGALMIGSAEEIAEKILRHSEALGGISRFTFQMDNAELSQKQLLKSIELIGEKNQTNYKLNTLLFSKISY